jgi:predicted Fe-Mo cluster-binding NifX family protein
LEKLRLAVATREKDGLEDVVSNVFGRAKTFTIIDAEDEKIKDVIVVENPGLSYKHGAGPIVAKMLVDKHVDVVIAYVLGLGADELLKQHNIKHIAIKPNTKVETATREALCILEKEGVT